MLSKCSPWHDITFVGFSLAERAGGVGDGDGPASEGDHLLGQVPASNVPYALL